MTVRNKALANMSFLKNTNTGIPVAWSAGLAKRDDMVPITPEEAERLIEKKQSDDKDRVAKRVAEANMSPEEKAALDAERSGERTLAQIVADMSAEEVEVKAEEIKLSFASNAKPETRKKKLLAALEEMGESDDGSDVDDEPSVADRVNAMSEEEFAETAKELKVAFPEDASDEDQKDFLATAIEAAESTGE